MKHIIFIALLALTGFFCACKSLEKQRNNAKKFYQEHPNELAAECYEKFPSSIEFREGKKILIPGDTVTIPGPTVQCPEIPATAKEPAKPGIKLRCPDSKIITDTIKRVDTFRIENTARVFSLQYRLDTTAKVAAVLRDQLSKMQTVAIVRMWWIIGLLIFIGIAIFLRVRKII